METVGKRLKAWRKSMPLTLQELSHKVRVSPGSLSDLENDKSKPSAKTLANLNVHFSLNIGWLLTGKESLPDEHHPLEEKPVSPSEINSPHQDKKLNEMIQQLIRTYKNGDPRDIAFLSGFLFGIEPWNRIRCDNLLSDKSPPIE